MITIQNAILHIIDGTTQQMVLSQKTLDHREERIRSYIIAMCEKVMMSSKQRTGIMPETAPLYSQLHGLSADFIPLTQNLTEIFYQLVRVNPDIPPADLLWVQVKYDDFPFVGMFKLNQSDSVTHFVDYDDEQLKNEIILHHSILPSAKQSIDEGMLFCVETDEFFLIEKAHKIEELGERVDYFSQYYLQVVPILSVNENVKIIKKAVEQTAKDFDDPTYEALAQAKEILYSAAMEEEEGLATETIARALYGDNMAKKQAYSEKVEELGFVEKKEFSADQLTPKMKQQKLKLSNGIVISIPMELFHNRDSVEIRNNPDGTLNVVLKNIDDIKNMF